MFTCMASLLFGLPSEQIAAIPPEHSQNWYGDPATAAALRLGDEIFLPLSQEVKELDMILDLGQSPKHLKQLSPSHAVLLQIALLLFASAWDAASRYRSKVWSASRYLRVTAHIPEASPTLRWFSKAIFSLLDISETSDLGFKLKLTTIILNLDTSL